MGGVAGGEKRSVKVPQRGGAGSIRSSPLGLSVSAPGLNYALLSAFNGRDYGSFGASVPNHFL